jgi:hypothetical protein
METVETRLRLSRVELALLVLAVIACRILAIAAFPIYDDAFITYRYAANLAAGHGLVFNPGASWEPVLGTTTPGYALLLAGLASLGMKVLDASLCVNILCDAVSAVVLARLLGSALVPSTVALLAFASIPEIARVSVGGMEPPLFVLLALIAVAFHAENKPLWSGLATALCCTVRPEAALLAFILLGHLWLTGTRRVRATGLFVVPLIVVGAISAGALWYVYGSPISQSVVAKAQVYSTAGWFRVREILSSAFGPSLPMRLVLVIVVLGFWRSCLRRGALFPFTLFAAAMVAAYLLAQKKTWGWYFYLPLTAWCAWLGLGTDKLVEWIGEERIKLFSERKLRWLPIALAVGAVIAVGTYSRLRPDQVTPLVYKRLESWAREARLEERQATVLASDIGAIGYYGRTRVLDSQGLVWPEALSYPGRNELIRAHLPDYVMLVAIRLRVESFVEDEVLGKVYRPIRRFDTLQADVREGLSPRPRGLPYSWRQDYIIYERIQPGVGE